MKEKKIKKSTALAETGKETKLAAPVGSTPDYVKRGNAEGLENVSPNDIVLPRIKLMQALSPEVTAGKFKPGDMVNSLTGLKYAGAIEFIPVLHYKSRMFWQDRSKGNAVLCSAPDGKKPIDPNAAPKIAKQLKIAVFPKAINNCDECPFSQFATEEDDPKDRAPKCTYYHNFPILIKGDRLPSALAMSRTKLKVGQNLLSLAMTAGEAIPIYSKYYKLTSILEKKNNNTYYNFVIEPAGWATEEEYQHVSALCKSYKGLHINVEVDHPDSEAQRG